MTNDFGNDIPLDVAQRAHAGTSFVPEDRARQERDEYTRTLSADLEVLGKLADTDAKRAALEAEFARYREGLRARWLKQLHARSRCLSTMISGPSNFPASRYQKRSDAVDRRLSELVEFRGRALAAIRRALCPEKAPIMAGDADAVERLRAKIAEAEARQERMKAINETYRAFLKRPQSLDASGLSDGEKALVRAYKPEYSFDRQPCARYELTNNSANIRRMRERLAEIEATKAAPTTEAQGEAARIEDSPAENRVRLYFPGKPDEGIRTTLKRNGFRWTPSLACWQAYRNSRTLELAREIAKVG